MKKLNYAVFNLKTKFRMTEYKSRNLTMLAYNKILQDQPNLKGKIGVRQKDFENGKVD